MRRPLLSVIATLALLGCCFGRDPVGDWQSVQQDIPRGWQITVVTSMTFPCVFKNADERELICAQLDRGEASEREEIHIRRERIREIRVERRQGANMLAGVAGGGTVGAGLGAILGGAGSRGRPAYALGLLGSSMGARTGRSIHTLHGKVIYRRP